MIVLTIRTDKPEAEVGLYDNAKQLGYNKWQAHRQLAETLHKRINDLLNSNDKASQDIGGIIVFEGPGSFTGLRIGISVANSLAYSLDIPLAGSTSDNWIKLGQRQLDEAKGQSSIPVLPIYGAPVHITAQRK